MKSKNILFVLVLAISSLVWVSCGEKQEESKAKDGAITFIESRWYTKEQFELGDRVFSANCAHCHGGLGQGLVEDWKTPNPDGQFPAPPLNGTAHTWHHSKEVLIETINNGGIPFGGSMPAFKNVLTEEEKEAVIAFIQNLWDDEIYRKWEKTYPVN